ncbi:flagellar filament capping protein FliD [Desulfopila sp. IMCC35008]|uniref:flagellar filament capping protein FliD n=1 Tax=Desulfopila sp. IMCC35008 TaxID=2653858 RepID=UPI0013CFE31E|nr:flagellar filament capping protein FliD [Desulfopila sp. IMCC35008]
MSISFGGLASGMDTNSIIEQLMNIERAPVVSMETDKTWLNNKLTAYKEFDNRLKSFLSSVDSLVERDQYSQTTLTQSSDEFFSASASEGALPNTNYRVEVVGLAQREKSYTDGFTSKTDQTFGTGDLTVTVNGVNHVVKIDDTNNSLEGIMNAINDAEIYVNTTIINDGTDTNPFRLTITGNDVGSSIEIDDSALIGGDGLGIIYESQPAQQAHVRVDGIDIYSQTNEIKDIIPGVTLDLLKAQEGEINTIKIGEDNSAIQTNVNAFVTSYNEVISFVSGQSTLGDTAAGVLGGDSGLSAIKRHLQDMLTSFVDTDGTYTSLSQLGLETQKDGQLSLNSSDLSKAIKNDEESVINLLAGKVGEEENGIASRFKEYLTDLTSSADGLLAGRTKSINDNIARIDANIEKTEARLQKREATLKSQFNAMEQLVSTMNSTSSFLSTQLSSLESLWNYNK